MDLTIRYLTDENDVWVWRVLIDGEPSGDYGSFASAAAMGISDAGAEWGQPHTAAFGGLAPN